MKKTELWLTPDGSLFTIQWNPCNCCPDWVIRTRGNRFYQSVSYATRGKAHHSRILHECGNERIDTW